MKKIIAMMLATVMFIMFVGCSDFKTKENDVFTVAMVTDCGGVNDQSFNQSAWEGLLDFSAKTGAKVSYLESTQPTDFATNLDKLSDRNCDLIWGIGFDMADSIETAAKLNLDLSYAIADNVYENPPLNVTGVEFRSQEASFLVGYIAAKTTKTNTVGFIGGISSDVIDRFRYGYMSGVKYGAKEIGKDINISCQYVESFTDAAKGKATASKMFMNGCDIIFHASGGCGNGVIEAAKETGNYAIGVDRDQAYLAPGNVLTSALKKVGSAVELVSTLKMNGEDIGGKNLSYGLKEDCVGIPEDNPNLDPVIYSDTMKIKEKIINDEIVPPSTEKTYNDFLSQLL